MPDPTIINAIAQLAKTYARCVDRRDFSPLPEIFSDDASLAVISSANSESPLYQFTGLEEIGVGLGFIAMYPRTFHMLGQQTILEYREGHARSETYCTASHFYPLDGSPHVYTMYIRYIDTLKLIGDKWKFTSRQVWVDAEDGVAKQA